MTTMLGVFVIGLVIFAALYGAGWLFFRVLRASQDAAARRRGDLPAEHKTRAERARARRAA
jgi:hypothetical protein